MRRRVFNLTGSEQVPLMDSLERYNDLSGPLIGVEFSDKVKHYQPFKKDSFELDVAGILSIITIIVVVVVVVVVVVGVVVVWPWGRLSC
jgi:hypothetical protein